MSRPRSSSIPRQYHRSAPVERFSVTDAAHLKLKLQALDAAISGDAPRAHRPADIKRIVDACQSCPFYEAVYIDGSEEFYLLVKSIPRPDLIPQVYIQAYNAALHGRWHENKHHISDFTKGVDPTFSEIRVLLGDIDRMCETNLDGAYRTLEDKVNPFPFLRLPPELRLHVYSYLMPREPHIALLFNPTRHHTFPRLRLDLMRVNSQIYHETCKYLYENRTLFLLAAQVQTRKTWTQECILRYYQVVASMNPQTRQLFKRLEIQVEYMSEHHLLRKPPTTLPCDTDPMAAIFSLLPSLETLIVSPCASRHALSPHHVLHQDLTDAVSSLIQFAPPSVEIIWDLTHAFAPRARQEVHPLWPVIQSRGSINTGAGVLAQLARSDFTRITGLKRL